MNSKSLKDILKTVLSLAMGLLIVWLLYRNTDINTLWGIVKNAHLEFILISLIFGLIGNIIRGLRWEVFINSLGYHPKRLSVIYATLGNYAVNFLLPRAGDVWRCAALTRYEGVPFAKAFETYLVDKIFDLLASVLLVILSMILYLDFFISYFRNNPDYGENIVHFFSSVWFYGILIGLVIIFFIVFKVFKNASPVKKMSIFFKGVIRDLKMVAHMKEKKRIVFYTILVWFSFYLYFYICFYAFDFTKGLGPLAGLIVFTMSNVGVAVPVQGGVGAWHFMVISSLVILGVGYEEGGAFAGAVFTIQSVWIILCGVVGIMALPYMKRTLQYPMVEVELKK